MAAAMRSLRSAFGDEDKDGPYDLRYPGRRVVANGGRATVLVNADQRDSEPN
jgi:hypothetical protein